MSNTRLLEDVPATLIPAGTATMLPAGEGVFIVQTLGGNVTVRTDHGLFRIARADAAAIAGLDLAKLDAEAGGGPSGSAGAGGAGVAAAFSEAGVWEALKGCFDPEIPVNIVDLGLIYDLDIDDAPGGGKRVDVKMTLTAPGCGMGPVIAEDARQRVAALPEVSEARVHIVWDPQWTPQLISPTGRKQLGIE
jgi:probable FeS assembly SUF system protein SufT